MNADQSSKDIIAEEAIGNLNKLQFNMYGATLTRPKGEPGRDQYFILPYNRTGSGANVIVACADSKGREYIALARKYLNVRKPELGLEGRAILPGGYMQPEMPLTHFGRGGPTHANDLAEELHLKGLSLQEAYERVAASAQESGIPKADIDMRWCAIREAHQELGLPLEQLVNARCVLVSEISRHGYSNSKDLHTVACNYMLDLGAVSELPQLKPGSDVASAWWQQPRHIQYTDGPPRPFDAKDSRYTITCSDGAALPGRDDHLHAADQAIREFRSYRLLQQFRESFDSLQAKVEMADPALKFLRSPVSHMGYEGRQYHLEMLRLAQQVSLSTRATMAALLSKPSRMAAHKAPAPRPS